MMGDSINFWSFRCQNLTPRENFMGAMQCPPPPKKNQNRIKEDLIILHFGALCRNFVGLMNGIRVSTGLLNV